MAVNGGGNRPLLADVQYFWSPDTTIEEKI
jgi:hypothetical protein